MLLAARLAAGAAVEEVIRAARPPIFYKHQDSFRRQLAIWSEPRLRPELGRLAEAELNMKTTGLPAETICRAALLRSPKPPRTRAEAGRGKQAHPSPEV